MANKRDNLYKKDYLIAKDGTRVVYIIGDKQSYERALKELQILNEKYYKTMRKKSEKKYFPKRRP